MHSSHSFIGSTLHVLQYYTEHAIHTPLDKVIPNQIIIIISSILLPSLQDKHYTLFAQVLHVLRQT